MPSSRRPLRAAASSQVTAAAVRSADAELSSVESSLADMIQRLASLIEGLQAAGDQERWNDLLAVQKSLEAAARRLSRHHA